ncbi:MAG: hypothetical protein ABW076_10865 [Candidatus Thiodiazotropha sp.]
MTSSGVQQGYLDPDQLYNSLIQQALNTYPVEIINQYRLPEVSNVRLQRDAPLLYLRGAQVYTYGFEMLDPEKRETSVSAIVIVHVPNNRAPITLVDGFGISAPSGLVEDPGVMRQELIRFINSYQYDSQWVQYANAQTINFESNLSARENAFYSTQQQIHQNNMDALDRSHQSFMDRSAASDRSHQSFMDRSAATDRMQSQTIDSIHERQQLFNPDTGERYEADGYYDYNYVNPNDPSMLVRSNDPLYDPNINNQQGEYYEQLETYPQSSW